jgi:hypothetical protein
LVLAVHFLLALEAHARDWSIATLTLNSTLTARHFYERCGFAIAGGSDASLWSLVQLPLNENTLVCARAVALDVRSVHLSLAGPTSACSRRRPRFVRPSQLKP